MRTVSYCFDFACFFSYHANAQIAKAKLSSAPFRPAEKFLKWIEFAAEFPDLTELNLAGAELGFCVYHSLDVLAPAAVSIVVIVTVGYYIIAMTVGFVVNLWLRRQNIDPKQKIQ